MTSGLPSNHKMRRQKGGSSSSVYNHRARHTPETRKEATRRERVRVQEIRLAYKSLQRTLKLSTDGRPKYLHTLQTAIAYIRYLEDKLGLRVCENPGTVTSMQISLSFGKLENTKSLNIREWSLDSSPYTPSNTSSDDYCETE